MRGRVGRSNKKALLLPAGSSPSTPTEEARKRLQAIEQFSDLGSGFNVAMRDLDIRGAGNLLGAELAAVSLPKSVLTCTIRSWDEAITELKNDEFQEFVQRPACA